MSGGARQALTRLSRHSSRAFQTPGELDATRFESPAQRRRALTSAMSHGCMTIWGTPRSSPSGGAGGEVIANLAQKGVSPAPAAALRRGLVFSPPVGMPSAPSSSRFSRPLRGAKSRSVQVALPRRRGSAAAGRGSAAVGGRARGGERCLFARRAGFAVARPPCRTTARTTSPAVRRVAR